MLKKCVLVSSPKCAIFLAFLLVGVLSSMNALAALNAGTIGSSQTICSGVTPNAFTSITPASNGTGTYNYQWQQSTTGLFTGYLDIVGATSITYAPGALTQTTYFRRAVSTVDDAVVYSDPVTITVDPASVGGTIYSSRNSCSGSDLTILTLGGYAGSILQWEYTVNIFTPVWIPIANTTNILTISDFSTTKYYRVKVQNGTCAIVYSTILNTTANPSVSNGRVSSPAPATICGGINNSVFTLNGYSGTILHWESSPTSNFASPTVIANTTNQYTAVNLITTTYYRVATSTGSCPLIYSTYDGKEVLPYSIGGTINGSDTVCSGTNSTLLTLSGHTGTILRWESSTSSNFSSPTTISNTTTSYTVTNISQTTYYRAVVKMNSCPEAYSTTGIVLIDPNTAVGGSITGGGTYCTSAASLLITLTGYTGTIVKWQAASDAAFTNILFDINVTTPTLSVGRPLPFTRYYRAVVIGSACSAVNSAVTEIIIVDQTVAGTTSGGTTHCTTTNNTNISLSGQTGSILRWESSANSNFIPKSTIANTTSTLPISNLTTTTYYRAVVRSGTCDSLYNSSSLITILTPPSVGNVLGSDSICASVIPNSTLLTLSSFSGTIAKWQSSTSSTFANNITDIVNTTNTYTATNITTTTYYRVIVTNGSCIPDTSTIGVVFIYPISVGGGVFGNNPFNPNVIVCTGTNSSTLVLTGYTGNIVKWQSCLNSNFTGTITDIANTTSSYIANNLTATTYYRVIVKSGECDSAISTTRVITVNPVSDGGLLGSDTVCIGTNATTLRLINYVGTVVKWESSSVADFSSGIINITNTTDSLTITNLASTIYYRVIVKSGVCSADTSNIANITLNAASVGGVVSGGGHYCPTVTFPVLFLTTHVGTIVRWERCALSDFSSNVIPISFTSTNYSTTINTPSTFYYRAVIKNGVCSEAYSTIDSITIDSTSVGGNIAGSTTVCSGINSTNLTASGYTGAILKWQSSTNATFSNSIIDISNTTNTYAATNLTTTTYYRVIVKNGECDSAFSTIGVITVNPISEGGLLTSDTVCSGVNSTTLHLTNYTGAIVKWQRSTTIDFSSNISSISNTTDSLVVTNLSTTTYYRAIVKSGVCSADTSNIVNITVTNPSTAGVITGAQIVCAGINSVQLQLGASIGNIVRWQSSTSSSFTSNVTDINATSATLVLTNLTTTTYVRVIVKNGICDADTSLIVVINVDVPTEAGVLLTSDTVCAGVNSSTLHLANYTGAIVKWERSTTIDFSSNISSISNTTDSLVVTNLLATTYYRAIVKSGVCAADTSNIVNITVTNPSEAGVITGAQIVCAGINSVQLQLGISTGNIVKWQSSTSSSFTSNVNDLNSTSTTLVLTNLTTTTYVRVFVKNGICDEDTSLIIVINVDVPSEAGLLLKSDTVCSGTNFTTLHLTNYTGAILKWERSNLANFSSGVASITNTTDSLIVTNLATTTYYRAIVKNGVCDADTSNIIHITVTNGSVAGTISGATTVCTGINNVQLQLNASIGTILKWQRSTSSNFSTNITDINTTSASINIINLTTTTYVRVLVKNGICDADTSLIIVINVDVPSEAGLLLKSDTVCAGVNSTTLHLVNYTGAIVKWESATSSDFSSNVSSINNTTDSLVVTNLFTTTYYRVVVKSGVCDADTSNIVFVLTFNIGYTNIIYTPQPDSFISTGNPPVIMGSVANTDSVFYLYQWQSSILSDSTGFAAVGGANTRDFDPPTITQTTWYRRILINPYCSVNDTSNVVVIVIVNNPVNSNPLIGSSKSVSKPKVISFGSYHIQYTITLKNYGNTDLHNIRVLENLKSVFPFPAVFSIVTITSGSSLSVNQNFDGVNNLELLNPVQSSLNIGESSTITIKVLLNPNLPNVIYQNQVLVFGDVMNGSTTVVDTSVNGDSPDPNGDGIPDEDSPTPVTIAVFVPSGYSPNGDGKNDEFIIVGLENYPNNRLEIYNRWGNKVFEQAPYDNTWKGTVKNINGYVLGEGLLPSGTYFYLLDFGVPGVDQLTGYIVIRK